VRYPVPSTQSCHRIQHLNFFEKIVSALAVPSTQSCHRIKNLNFFENSQRVCGTQYPVPSTQYPVPGQQENANNSNSNNNSNRRCLLVRQTSEERIYLLLLPLLWLRYGCAPFFVLPRVVTDMVAVRPLATFSGTAITALHPKIWQAHVGEKKVLTQLYYVCNASRANAIRFQRRDMQLETAFLKK
jgi:hypothetical protein